MIVLFLLPQVDYFKFTRVLEFSRVGGRQLLRGGAVQDPLPPYAGGCWVMASAGA